MPSLEIALFDTPPEGVISTLSTYASRLEVCGGPYSSGGLTASPTVVRSLRQSTNLPIHAMLRPRSGDFTYSAAEFRSMETDLRTLIEAGASGVVFGVIHKDNIDEVRTRSLCEQAKALGVTCVFHRAFDEVPDWCEAMAVLKRCGIDAVLTSGAKGNATDSALRLKKIREEGLRLGVEVIVGGGVRSTNIKDLQREIVAEWFHSAALVDGTEEVSEDEVRHLRATIDEAYNNSQS